MVLFMTHIQIRYSNLSTDVTRYSNLSTAAVTWYSNLSTAVGNVYNDPRLD